MSRKKNQHTKPFKKKKSIKQEYSLLFPFPSAGGHESAVLREVQVPVWKNSDCDDAYTQPITNAFICAGFTEGGRDACQVWASVEDV